MADMPDVLVAEEDFNRLTTLIEKQGDSDVADGLGVVLQLRGSEAVEANLKGPRCG